MLLSVVDKHAPFKRRRIRNKPSPWLTCEIRQLLNYRDQFKRHAIRTKLLEDWEKYKNIINCCNNKIKKAKVDYYQNKFRQSAGNPKEIWNTMPLIN